MKEYLKQLSVKIGLVASVIFIIIHLNNDYMETKNRECVVLDKMTTTGGYKRSGRI